MNGMPISIKEQNSKSNHSPTASHFTEWGALSALLTDALVVIPAGMLVLGACFSLIRDALHGVDWTQTLIALVITFFSVGLGFLMLRALYRFKVDYDDELEP